MRRIAEEGWWQGVKSIGPGFQENFLADNLQHDATEDKNYPADWEWEQFNEYSRHTQHIANSL